MDSTQPPGSPQDTADLETREWMYSFDYVVRNEGPERAVAIIDTLQHRAAEYGLVPRHAVSSPYVNTIPRPKQPRFPGQREIERRIKSLIRWNAMAMVVRANREESGIGGHISTYASAATLYEIGFNHFFHGPQHAEGADQVFFQGHASPGIYARAFLEGRLSEQQLAAFRRELKPGGGISSYPHPWLMPDFWQFPTVSMGLGPIMAIYQARFNRYLEDRGLAEHTGRVWAFVGDGEMDEPEALGAISLAGRSKLDNLVFVANCNLQRLDGPVRGNGKIIQELETVFRGAGWNVIKVVWGDSWDPLFERDTEGLLLKRLEELVDGDFQKYAVETGAYVREHLFGKDPRLLELVQGLSDEELRRLRRGGHDPEKVYAAYAAAVEHRGSPTIILAQTVKGYGLGEAGEGKNITHQQKKLNEIELREFRSRFGIPISDEQVGEAPFYRPAGDSPELRYLHERRRELGGYLPVRQVTAGPLPPLSPQTLAEFRGGFERPVATTMAFVRMLAKLLRDSAIGARVVPIIPDEARTFGMESLFRQVGIYSHVGQRYEPVDRTTLLYYKEARNGQILEEGITESGAMASFIAAGSSYATHGVMMLPFFVFYSMFGFQRAGDLIWAAGDCRCRGFMVGGTAGKTTLSGEGLQHQDGHSHLLAYPHPNIRAYDPAFAYEIAVILEEGIRRMTVEGEDLIYYLTVANELYPMPGMPPGSEEGILKGMYRLSRAQSHDGKHRAHLLGSGPILNEAIAAAEILERYGVVADVWSVTSYKQLFRDAMEAERYNRLHPAAPARRPYVTELLANEPGVVVAASDYTRALPLSVARFVPGRFEALGADGFGRSDGRAALRDFFEVDAKHIAAAALAALAREGRMEGDAVERAIRELGIDPERPDSVTR